MAAATETQTHLQAILMEQPAVSSTDPFTADPFFPLKEASSEILAALRADEASPDADLFRRIAHSSNSYESAKDAANAFDYRISPATLEKISPLSQKPAADISHVHRSIQHVKSIPLPQQLALKLAAETKLCSLMGTFPDAQLVWVSLDNTLYIWEYETHGNSTNARQDFVAFTVPTGQCVVSVGLVPPKPGEYIYYCVWQIYF